MFRKTKVLYCNWLNLTVPEEQLSDQVPDVMRMKENKDECLPKVAIFGDAVKNVYVRHDPESDYAIGRTIVIFDVI